MSKKAVDLHTQHHLSRNSEPQCLIYAALHHLYSYVLGAPGRDSLTSEPPSHDSVTK